jgi:hypothetical protein
MTRKIIEIALEMVNTQGISYQHDSRGNPLCSCGADLKQLTKLHLQTLDMTDTGLRSRFA